MMELRQDIGCTVKITDPKSYVGCVVRSVAGRDAKRIFAIVAIEEDSGAAGGYVWLADGQLRRLEKPKRKKLRHLRLLSEADPALALQIAEDSLTNRALFAYLKSFESMTHEEA